MERQGSRSESGVWSNRCGISWNPCGRTVWVSGVKVGPGDSMRLRGIEKKASLRSTTEQARGPRGADGKKGVGIRHNGVKRNECSINESEVLN